MKLRRRTAQLKHSAIESLSLAVELFNRPSQVARDQAVMLLLAHSFEMLLKAIIFQSRGAIRDPGERYTYKLSRCINIAHGDLKVVAAEDLPMMRAIKQDRNAAAHDLVSFSEDMLWLHVRSTVTIIGKLLKTAFDEDIADVIPTRVIPVSALPPTDAHAVIAREMQDIANMLKPGLRRSDEAKARIRPLLALDGSVTGREEGPTEQELDRAVNAFRRGRKWEDVFPGLTAVEIGAEPGSGAQEITLRLAKDGEGPSVRAAKPGESALLYRKSNPFDEYGTGLKDFGPKLGLTPHQGQALIWKLRIKDDPGAYFVRKTGKGNIRFQGLSARAFVVAREAMATEGFDIDAIVREYNTRAKER